MSSGMRTAVAGELRSRTASSETMNHAVMAFQRMAHIPVTGIIDEQTKIMMTKPRCGNKDIYVNSRRRRKRYSTHDSKWQKNDLTWTLGSYSGTMDPYTQLEQLKKGINLWEGPSFLKFQNVQGGASTDFIVGFHKNNHGDGAPFDGQGGVLAHAFFPSYGGNVHIDDSEPWTVNSDSGYNLLSVTAHEMGHALGLKHSEVKGALMAPYYQPFSENQDPNSLLKKDDVDGIQDIYGVNPQYVVGGGSGNGAGGRGFNFDYCKSGEIDAIFSVSQHITYIFRGNHVIRLHGDRVVVNNEWPNYINVAFKDGPTSVEAAFFSDNLVSLISGDSVYFYSKNLQSFGTLSKKTVFPEIQDVKIDTAFIYDHDLYIFQGATSYKLYKQQSSWLVYGSSYIYNEWDIPNNCQKVTAACTWTNGRTYMFCETETYIRMNHNKKVDFSPSAPYPRPTAMWWLPCSNTNNLVALPSESEQTGHQDNILNNDASVFNTATSKHGSLSVVMTLALILVTYYT